MTYSRVINNKQYTYYYMYIPVPRDYLDVVKNMGEIYIIPAELIERIIKAIDEAKDDIPVTRKREELKNVLKELKKIVKLEKEMSKRRRKRKKTVTT